MLFLFSSCFLLCFVSKVQSRYVSVGSSVCDCVCMMSLLSSVQQVNSCVKEAVLQNAASRMEAPESPSRGEKSEQLVFWVVGVLRNLLQDAAPSSVGEGGSWPSMMYWAVFTACLSTDVQLLHHIQLIRMLSMVHL